MKISFTVVLMLLSYALAAQKPRTEGNDSIESRVVVIGDAGDTGTIVNGKMVVIDAVRQVIPMDKKTTVLFVGDNIYQNGLPCVGDVCYMGSLAMLDSQAFLVKGTDAHAYFLPGNHDWANGKPEGLGNILRQGQYIDQVSPGQIKFYPENGCPGPVEVPLGKDAVMIFMDSQWWLTRGERPGIESDCEFKTEEEVLNGIKDILDHNANKLVIFACHHPFKSTGVHSGYFGIKQHIFPFTDLKKNLYIPLPIIGSLYPISRSVFGSPQDMKFPLYANMIAKVENVLKDHPYVLHVAGHEHNLQLINDSNYHYLISGGGCKSQRVEKTRKTKFVAASRGFAVIDIMKNKTVRATFYTVDANTNQVSKAYSDNIINFSKFPELAKDTVTVHDLAHKDSAIAPANKDYNDVSAFKKVMLGKNYRKEWATPVKLKVFDVNKEKGGFKVERLGGGHQTKSLRLKDTAGNSWTLRTVNKDPEKVIPANFRKTFAADVVQDMISSANPYGALPVPVLAEAIGIVHGHPEYFIVPDDYSLGQYRTVFANNMCVLEEHDPTAYGEKGISTEEMFNKLRTNDKHLVDQDMLVKARMLDFLIADYDRHQDQWKWGKTDTGKPKTYYPIPHDRDQAFFYSQGLIIKYVTWQRLPFLKGFRYGMPRAKWQGYVARYFDREYLNEVNKDEWMRDVKQVKDALTDSVISASVQRLPPEIAVMDSTDIVAKLKHRRDILPGKSLAYYRFLAKRVNVLGSNMDEYFHLSKEGDGIALNVYARGKNGDTGLRIYSRVFDPHETKELRLYGFNGNDVFRIDADVKARMKVRMIGGQGNDTFDIKGRTPNFIYDFAKENSAITEHHHTRMMISDNPLVNEYNQREDNYNEYRFPHLQLGYNPEDGFLAGVGIFMRTYNFRKLPYSTDQKLTTLFALANNAYQVKYLGEFRNLFHGLDLVADGEYINPTLNNFFGFGNDTKKIPGADLQYYRVRFTDLDGTLMVRKQFFRGLLSIGAGPTYYYYNSTNAGNANKILAHPADVGLDSTSIYRPKSYAGGKLMLNVNNLNGELFPTRGVEWNTTLTSMAGLDDNSKPLTKLESNMAIYASLTDPAKVVAVIHLGAGHIFSEQYEYFQALTLGANNYLRGFRKDRFAGSSVAYGSLELRVKLIDVNSYIVPGSFGLVGFNDIGRVWVKGENSNTWHDAYGGGFYYTPFNLAILSLTTAFSSEEALINFAIGAKINLTF